MKPLDLAAWAVALLLASTLFAHTIALRLFLLVVGLGLVAVAIARDRHSVHLLPPLWIPLAFWAAWALASLAWSLEPERTARELRTEIGYSIATFWLCFVAAQARGAFRVILPVVALTAIAVNALALRDFLSGGWHEYTVGLPGGPGNHSSALVILIPCAVAATWYGHQAKKPFGVLVAGWSLVILLTASAYATLNRTIWIALALQAGLLAALAFRRSGIAIVSRRGLILLIASAVLTVCAVVMVYAIQSERAAAHIAGSMQADPRLALWSEALEKIAERPLTGYGFGRGLLRESLRAEFQKVELWHSHNLFLDTALQTGFPGLALLAALFSAILWQGWKLTSSNLAAEACGAALIAVVLGTIVRNMTDVLWVRQNALLFWGMVGILLSWGTQRRLPGG